MDISLSWVQFLVLLTIALAVYAGYVVIKFYPHILPSALFWKRRNHQTLITEGYSEFAPDNIMGGIRPSGYVKQDSCKTCLSCGHLTPDRTAHQVERKPALEVSPKAKEDVVAEAEEEEEVFTMELQSLAPPEETLSNGGVDLDSLSQIIDQTAQLVEAHSENPDTLEARQSKSELMAVIAADLTLNTSDFARQIAATLDSELPSTSFSGVETLQVIAA